MENRRYGGIATREHFAYHKVYTTDFDCYSLLFISKKPSYKEIWTLSTFRDTCFLNIIVTEAYILKCGILVNTLFAMVSSNSEMQAISGYFIV